MEKVGQNPRIAPRITHIKRGCDAGNDIYVEARTRYLNTDRDTANAILRFVRRHERTFLAIQTNLFVHSSDDGKTKKVAGKPRADRPAKAIPGSPKKLIHDRDHLPQTVFGLIGSVLSLRVLSCLVQRASRVVLGFDGPSIFT
jgi:hypothetical protein